MSSALTGGIVSYDGSTPGITEGLNAALPLAGLVPGDLYITTDTGQVYRWTGSTWIVILSSGGGGTILGTAVNQKVAVGVAPNTIGPSNLAIIGLNLFWANVVTFVGACQLGFDVQTPASGGTFTGSNFLTLCNATAAFSITADITLITKGQMFVFKKIAGSNAVTIHMPGGVLIDGVASFSFGAGPAKASAMIEYDGTNFWVI